MTAARPIILASGSAVRRKLLGDAGVPYQPETARVDERALAQDFFQRKSGAPLHELALFLAQQKALEVSARHHGALVIGCDQVLALGERFFSKARDRTGARQTLAALRGKTHQLHSAVALAQCGSVEWAVCDTAHLRMRNFSDAFLDRYLDEAGEALTRSVGCYEFEGLGLQLFERIEGDYFTILGLPMIPLLGQLRAQGAVSS